MLALYEWCGKIRCQLQRETFCSTKVRRTLRQVESNQIGSFYSYIYINVCVPSIFDLLKRQRQNRCLFIHNDKTDAERQRRIWTVIVRSIFVQIDLCLNKHHLGTWKMHNSIEAKRVGWALWRHVNTLTHSAHPFTRSFIRSISLSLMYTRLTFPVIRLVV